MQSKVHTQSRGALEAPKGKTRQGFSPPGKNYKKKKEKKEKLKVEGEKGKALLLLFSY